MMQDGAFRRFVNSPIFKQYSNTRADFSMSTVGIFNPMTVLPSDGEAELVPGGGTQLNIRQYIQSL